MTTQSTIIFILLALLVCIAFVAFDRPSRSNPSSLKDILFSTEVTVKGEA